MDILVRSMVGELSVHASGYARVISDAETIR